MRKHHPGPEECALSLEARGKLCQVTQAQEDRSHSGRGDRMEPVGEMNMRVSSQFAEMAEDQLGECQEEGRSCCCPGTSALGCSGAESLTSLGLGFLRYTMTDDVPL